MESDLQVSGSYAGADPEQANRFAAYLWAVAALIAAVLLPISRPTAAIGSLGWVVAGADIAGALLCAALILRRGLRLSFPMLLACNYAGAAQVALLEWLAGGRPSPYHQLLLFCVLHASATQPRQRLYPWFAALALIMSAPLLYQGWSTTAAADIGTQYLLLCMMGGVVCRLMTGIRSQRLASRAQSQEAEQRARHDALTGLRNRRAFDEELPAAAEQAQARREQLAVLVVDVDCFKAINDRFGHLEGDRCLRAVSDAIRAGVRATDSCFRWGGDEFAVVLQDTTVAEAEKAAVRIAAELAYEAPDGARPSLSFGYARLAEGMTPQDLLHTADMALMDGKARRADAVPDLEPTQPA
jgi:diguanylate cyclase (GGDEF)-like protein